MSESASPLVSLVITTRDEERNITTCLRSIVAQTYSPIEVIVVDNSSRDDTTVLARAYTDKVFDVGPHRGAQANFGMLSVAQGEYVMYVDADMILAPALISACVRTLASEETVALQIPEIVLGRKFLSRVRRFERTFYDGTVIDAARFFRRDALQRAGGFDESLNMVDDWDLDKRIRQIGAVKVLPSPLLPSEGGDSWELAPFIKQRGVDPHAHSAVVFHNESEFQLRRYLGKKNYYANWLRPYKEKWAGDPDVRKQVGFGYRYFGVFFENGKWRRLMRHPVLAGGLYFLRFAVGGVYLLKLLRSEGRLK